MTSLLPPLLGVLALAGLLVPVPAAPDDAIEVDLLMLTTIRWEEGDDLPDEITELDDKTVKITGYMATDTLEGSREFKLITDQCGCDGAPKVHHFVLVDTGETEVGYRPDRQTVTGTISIGERHDDGFLVSLYRLKADSLE